MMVEIKNVHKIFNKNTVNENYLFCDYSLSVNKGDFVSVIGSNGSGKTTLLNIISGTTPIDAGNVFVGGADFTKLPEYKRSKVIGRVFQNPSVGTIPKMNIYENLALAENKGKPFDLGFAISKSKKARYAELVTSLGLGLEDKMEVPVGLLSGGQRQALSLLMSTLTPIDLLLLDEHTAALDPKTADVVMEITDKIVREKGITAIMVTHNLRYAVEYGNRIIMMHKGNNVLDKSGEEKKKTEVKDLLSIFNNISIECGN